MAVIAVLMLVLLDCDYYRFKELDSGAVNAYQNEYMSGRIFCMTRIFIN